MATIPLKYPGGKRSEFKFFEHWIPKEYNRYIEPFFGGGAVFFLLEPKSSIINDLNGNLVSFYRELASNPEEMLTILQSMKNEEEFYYIARDMFNGKIPSEYTTGQLFFYLNKTAYSGLVRYNSKGEFNVPFGRYKNYRPENFITRETSELLSHAEIMNDDFEEVFKKAKKDDFIFLDPPYMSPFTAYTRQKDGTLGFSADDQHRLLECFKQTEAKVLMVISDLGIIRELYQDYIKEEYEKTYAINIKNRMKEQNDVTHLIIANYDL